MRLRNGWWCLGTMLLIGVCWIYNVHTTILCEDTAICEIGYCTGRCSDGDYEGAINVLYGSLCVDALNPPPTSQKPTLEAFLPITHYPRT